MITRENIGPILNRFSKRMLSRLLRSKGDYVLLEVSFTNNTTMYEFATMDYDEEVEQEVNSRGNLFCDKDSFETLLKEVHKGFQN